MVSGPAQYGATALMLRCTKGDGKPGVNRQRLKPAPGMPLLMPPPDRPAFQPYWGKPAVRNERGDRGNVGIIRSPVRASILPDWQAAEGARAPAGRSDGAPRPSPSRPRGPCLPAGDERGNDRPGTARPP